MSDINTEGPPLDYKEMWFAQREELIKSNQERNALEKELAELKAELEGVIQAWNEQDDRHMKYEEELQSKPSVYEEALRGIIEIGKRDMSNPKYDSYFDAAKQALSSGANGEAKV